MTVACLPAKLYQGARNDHTNPVLERPAYIPGTLFSAIGYYGYMGEIGMNMTKAHKDALAFIAGRNELGMGAIMPHGEMIIAAKELSTMGLAEDRGGTERRWITEAGRQALPEGNGNGTQG